jgi:sulfoxide reductase heme-binding subunit YedZ
MTTAVVATVGHGYSALWYLTRATGLVSLILLSATVVLGMVASVGWASERWPRFLSQSVHRNLSLFCLALIGVHVVSTVADGYVPIGFLDAVLPFRSPYRPIWVGFGALAFDMLLAVAVTSALRRRIGTAAWRGVHWLAYACWPIAVVHGLGSGSDTRLPGTILVFALCVGSVAATTGWRLTTGRARSVTRRLAGALTGTAVLLLIAVFAVVGPLRSGWSHRAGTSQALLAQLAGSSTTSYTSAPNPSTATTGRPVTNGIPAVPFRTAATGTFSQAAPNNQGESEVDLSVMLGNTTVPLQIRIVGPAENGGVVLRRSEVTFGPMVGTVTALDGSTVGVVVRGPSGLIGLTLDLSLQQGAGTLTGVASGTALQ